MSEMRTLRRAVVLVTAILLAYGGPARARPPEGRALSEERLLSERRAPSARALLREELAARIAERRLLRRP